MAGFLKLVLGSEIRVNPEIPTSFKQLQDLTSEFYGVNSPCFQYKDSEDDLITFSTEKEYQYIIKNTDTNLKFFIISPTKITANSPKIQLQCGFPIENNTEGSLMLHIPNLSPLSLRNCTSLPNSHFSESNLENNSSIKEKNHEHEHEPNRKQLISEALRRSLPAEAFKSHSVVCSFCSTEINDQFFTCIQCEKHIMCLNCEQKDTRKHILIKCKVQDAIENLNIKMKKRPSFHLIKKDKDSISERHSENEEKTKVESAKETLGKDESRKDKVKKDSKDLKKKVVTDAGENTGKKITKDGHTSKKKMSVKKFTDDHADQGLMQRERSKSLVSDSDSDSSNIKRKTKAWMGKSPPREKLVCTNKINELLDQLKSLGFYNKTNNVNALIESKYKLEEAVNILLNNSV